MAFRACICPTPLGSSPRVWGRCCRRRDNIASRAVHPHACGADEYIYIRICQKISVHPHACGADQWDCQKFVEEMRFIPTRVGQILVNYLAHVPAPRFIPTRVGQMIKAGPTVQSVTRFIPTRVGQIHDRKNRRLRKLGSSPRVWGR